MSLCCNITEQEFTNEVVTTVMFTGDQPTVTVLYRSNDGTYTEAGVMTQIVMKADRVEISHGAPSTGIVKLIQ